MRPPAEGGEWYERIRCNLQSCVFIQLFCPPVKMYFSIRYGLPTQTPFCTTWVPSASPSYFSVLPWNAYNAMGGLTKSWYGSWPDMNHLLCRNFCLPRQKAASHLNWPTKFFENISIFIFHTILIQTLQTWWMWCCSGVGTVTPSVKELPMK